MQRYTPILANCFSWASKQIARTWNTQSSSCFPLRSIFAHLFLHLWPPNMWLFWPLSTCDALWARGPNQAWKCCFQLEGLLQRARDPKRTIPSVALQLAFTSVAFSLISPLEAGWLIRWMSSVYQSLTVERLRSSALVSQRVTCYLPGSFKIGSLICPSSFSQCWNILMTWGRLCVWCIDISYQMTMNMLAPYALNTRGLSRFYFHMSGHGRFYLLPFSSFLR